MRRMVAAAAAESLRVVRTSSNRTGIVRCSCVKIHTTNHSTGSPYTSMLRFDQPMMVRNFSMSSSFCIDPPTTDASSDVSVRDVEREMFAVRRRMTAYYNKGDFRSALQHAEQLLQLAEQAAGTRNAVYASSLNNSALMHKMLGQLEEAMEKYTRALQIYAEIAGKQSASYAATLCNLGVLYKDMVQQASHNKEQSNSSSGGGERMGAMEREQLLQRSDEALQDALDIRKTLHGLAHKDTLYSMVHLASLRKLQARVSAAIPLLMEALKQAEDALGERDLLVATIRNNLGLLFKEQGGYREAKEHYDKALEIRSKILGDDHPDTIVSMHNLAELCMAMGDSDTAAALQQQLLALIKVEQEHQEQHHFQPNAAVNSGKSDNSGVETSASINDSDSGGDGSVILNSSNSISRSDTQANVKPPRLFSSPLVSASSRKGRKNKSSSSSSGSNS